MNKKQKRLLLLLQQEKESCRVSNHPYDILIHAVLNTARIESLIEVYVYDLLREVKSSILSNIEKRIHLLEHSETLYENLKHILENGVDYLKAQRIRKILEWLLVGIDDSYKLDFFNTFFFSPYSNDKKTAVDYIKYSEKELGKELLVELFNSLNFKYLDVILNQKDKKIIVENIKDIWSLDPPFSMKRRLIEIVAPIDFSKCEFLKEVEFDFYLLAALKNKSISPQCAIKQLDSVPKERQHFTIFNLSKELNFQDIEDEIEKYIKPEFY